MPRIKHRANNKPDWSHTNDAIEKIVKSFVKKNTSRFLLVLPTGGGKTLTAIRAINELINCNQLNVKRRALWVVHTKALRIQAEKVINLAENISTYKFNDNLSQILEVRMIKRGAQTLYGSHIDEYRLIIVDEAHHSEAASYQSFFRNDMGVLGLTATPTRNDGRELKFDDDLYYSISFRELVKRGVLIKPKIISINTNITINTRDLRFISTNNQLELFNIKTRNARICSELFRKIDQYNLKKIVIFVGTNNHVKSLYNIINEYNKSINNKIQHVGFIYGGDNNDRNISNEKYLEDHVKMKSSILINCRILNEGYDDSSIDTVVMATPTSSILYYIQCVGRVVRNPKDGGRKAYVLEMVDQLPNVNYRIDNRWLYAEISDYLEPEIIDLSFDNKFDLKIQMKKIIIDHNIEFKYHSSLHNIQLTTDISLLLFNAIPDDFKNSWHPLLFSTKTKNIYTNVFNVLSNNIEEYYCAAYSTAIFGRLKIPRDDFFFSDRRFIADFIVALKEAYDIKQRREKVNNIKYFLLNKKKHNFFNYWLYWLYHVLKYSLTFYQIK